MKDFLTVTDLNIVEVERTEPKYQRAQIGTVVSIKCYTQTSEASWYREDGAIDDNAILKPPVLSQDQHYVHELVFDTFMYTNVGTYICEYQEEKFGQYIYFISKATIQIGGN